MFGTQCRILHTFCFSRAKSPLSTWLHRLLLSVFAAGYKQVMCVGVEVQGLKYVYAYAGVCGGGGGVRDMQPTRLPEAATSSDSSTT